MPSALSYGSANPGANQANREDIRDVLTILTPEDTPVLSMLNKSSVKATTTEVIVDDLSNPSFAGIKEGDDATYADKASGRAKLSNSIQHFRRGWQVSQIQERVSTAGVSNEVADAESHSMRELKLDIESAICSDQDKSVEDGTDARYLTRGLGDWIDAAGPSDVPAAYRTPGDSILQVATAELTEAGLNGVLQSRFEAVGSAKDALVLVCGPTLKHQITNFTRSTAAASSQTYSVNEDATSRKITLNVTQYESDFGILNLVPSLFLARTDGAALTTAGQQRGYVLDSGLLELGVLKAETNTQNDDLGGGKRGYVDFIGSLLVKSPKGLCKFKPS